MSLVLEEARVLHSLRVGGVLRIDEVSRRTAVARPRLDDLLIDMERSTLVRRHVGALRGWSLTVGGRTRGEELLAEELDSRGARPAVVAAYEEFRTVNGDLLAICTDWQVSSWADPVDLNDHSDPEYDRAVLSRLSRLDAVAARILGELAAELPRFGSYHPRLALALDRASSGGVDWVTRPLIDSYHTVWFELHEDLLATLGRRRTDEGDARAQQ